MENEMSLEKQYRNIVRKFFFRQNPPMPLTKEEYIIENQLQEESDKVIDCRYYSYFYSYNYQYVKELNQKVEKEIREGAMEDEYLAQIENELYSMKNSKKHKILKRKKEEKEVDLEDISLEEPKQKKNVFKKWWEKTLEKYEKRETMEEKEDLIEEDDFSVSWSVKKKLLAMFACGTISLIGYLGGLYGLFKMVPIIPVFGRSGLLTSLKEVAVPLLASTCSFVVGVIGWQGMSIVREGINEESINQKEEKIGWFESLKNRFLKAKEKKKSFEDEKVIQEEKDLEVISEEITQEKESSVLGFDTFKLKKKGLPGTPQFLHASSKEENQQQNFVDSIADDLISDEMELDSTDNLGFVKTKKIS